MIFCWSPKQGAAAALRRGRNRDRGPNRDSDPDASAPSRPEVDQEAAVDVQAVDVAVGRGEFLRQARGPYRIR